ncbi:MAG: hypothetical protein ABSD88_07960 [Candidatus Korobacteraceae bacterium]|jgi:hypothetical protein
MRRLALFLLIVYALTGMAQQGVPDPAGRQRAVLLGHRYVASYKDIYCAGFVTREQFPRGNFVVGGRSSPEVTHFGRNETVFLAGSDYEPGRRYAIIRDVRDPNRYEFYKGQNKALEQLGQLYAEVGYVTVKSIEDKYAVAVVDVSCQPLIPGDIVIAARDKGSLVVEPRSFPFSVFGVPLPKQHGHIVMSSDFDYMSGTRKAVYINLGSNAGLAPGDYLRISRSYDPATMSESSLITLRATTVDDTQHKAASIPRSSLKNWPLRGVGELVVISVTPGSATCMVTIALEEVQLGDIVSRELER